MNVGAIPVPLSAARVLGTANQITATPSGSTVTLSIAASRGLVQQGYANQAAAQAATPAFINQWFSTNDGAILASTSIITGQLAPLFVPTVGITYHLQNSQWNGCSVTVGGTSTLGIEVGSEVTGGPSLRVSSNQSGGDAPVQIYSLKTDGFAGIDMRDTTLLKGFTASYANSGVGSSYGSTSFFETFNDNASGSAEPLVCGFADRRAGGSIVRYTKWKQHTNGDFEIFKFDQASSLESAGSALIVKADGKVSIGDSTPGTTIFNVGTATPVVIGLDWIGYLSAPLARLGIEATTSDTGVEFIEAGARKWRVGSSGGTFVIADSTAGNMFSCTLGTFAATFHGTLNVNSILNAGNGTGAAGTYFDVGGTKTTDTTQTGNITTGEDTLQSYSVAASQLAINGQTFHFIVAGTIANTAATKQIRVKFGATTIFDSGAGFSGAALDWTVEGWIVRTGAATQKCICKLNTSGATTFATADYATSAETLSGAVTLLVTGEATNTNDIVKEIFKGYFEH